MNYAPRLGISLLAAALLGGPAAAQPLEVSGHKVELDITAASQRTVRIRISALDASGQPARAPDEPALVARTWPRPSVRLRSVSPPRRVQAGVLTVSVNTTPLSIRIESAGARAGQELRVAADTGELSFLVDGPVFGLGQGGLGFDRRGYRHSLAASYDPPEADMLIYGTRTPVPLLLGARGWALFLNRPKGDVDLTGSEGRIRLPAGAAPLPLDVFVTLDEEPAGLLGEYAALTGFAPLPPLWSFGYLQSHRTLVDRAAVFEIARKLRDRKIPCDGLIYLGTGFASSGWNRGNGDFGWNEKVFPDPRRDLAELREMNFRVILHVARPPVGLFGSIEDGFDDTADPNHVSRYWQRHIPALRAGAAGWWPDEGENLTDEGRMARIRMYWDGLLGERPGERPFSLHRTGYAGMQRYGSWLWTGDPASSWKTLAAHVSIGIQTGLSGIPYWGHDIGGFFPTKELTGELYARWFQFGAFSPLFRSHGVPSYLHFPWSWDQGTFGPAEFSGSKRPGLALPDEAELHNPQVEPICRKYAELRYRLLPYLYAAAAETAETGMPILRALWLHYSTDPAAVARGDEYLWGRDILAAPVVEKGARSRTLYLPRGTWYDFWTNERRTGGAEISRAVDLETMPLYVRAGAILPMGPVKQYTGERSDAPLELRIYPGADGSAVLYEDDGVSNEHQKGASTRIRCQWRDSVRLLRIEQYAGPPAVGRKFAVRLAGGQEQVVEFTGRPLSVGL